MSEDQVPLLKDRATARPAATSSASRTRPDIVIHRPHLEIPVDPKPVPRR
jgi:hypothetical protein